MPLPKTLQSYNREKLLTEQEVYVPPDEETTEYIAKIYDDFRIDAELRQRQFRIFNDNSIETVWAESLNDYLAFVDSVAPDDWVYPYVSTISRDKVLNEVALVLANSPRPSIVAQNKEQGIDREVARVLKIASEYAYRTDGFPSNSGKRKRLGYCLNQVMYGTVHVQEDMIDGSAVRTLVPNEEIYIPNLWQTDIQAQSHVLRVTNNVTYDEGRLDFGHLPNWKYVIPGSYENWAWTGLDEWKNYDNGVAIEAERLQIIRAWYPAQKRGKPSWYWNVIINGVPMYSWNKKSPYKHGYINIAKETFEDFETQCYWGQSLTWKVRHDKKWKDGWKTMMRAKQKLSIVPPFIAWNGLSISEDVIVPNKVTEMTGNPANLTLVHPEISKGITSADVSMMQMADEEIERGTQANIVSGAEPSGTPTARQIATQAAFAQINQGPTIDRFFNLEATLDYFRIHNIVQFWPKKKHEELSKISVPNAQLTGGRKGSFEMLFRPLPEMNEEEILSVSHAIRESEEESIKRKEPKEVAIIDPSYLRELTLYVMIEEKPVTDIEFVKELDAYDRLSKNPLTNQEELLRDLVRALGKDEDRLIQKREEVAPPAAPASQVQGVQGGTETGERLGLETAGAEAALRPELPSLPSRL